MCRVMSIAQQADILRTLSEGQNLPNQPLMPQLAIQGTTHVLDVCMRLAGYPETTTMAYLASSGLCIGAIGCLSSQKTARLGNTLGLLGVGGGVAACLGAMGGDPALLAQTLGTPM